MFEFNSAKSRLLPGTLLAIAISTPPRVFGLRVTYELGAKK